MLKLASRPRRTVADPQTFSISHRCFSVRTATRALAALATGTALATLALVAPHQTAAQPIAASLAMLGATGSGDAAFTVPNEQAVSGVQTFGAPSHSATQLQVDVSVGLLRSGPSTHTPRLARLRRGTRLTVLDQQNQWYHVQTATGRTGWVSAEIVASLDIHADSTSTSAPAVSTPAQGGTAFGHSVAQLALNYVGSAYRYGGTGPYSFDCSGLTRYIYGRFGIALPHQASAQWGLAGTRIHYMTALQPGDLVFFANTAGWGISHVAIYAGNGMMVTANTPRMGVQLSRITDSYWRAHWAGGLRISR